MITDDQEGLFYRVSTGRAANFENIKPQKSSTGDWSIPEDMEEGGYLMIYPACEVNEKGTREKNDGNEALKEVLSAPLDLDPNEKTEADEEYLPCAEEDWRDPEQIEIQTRQSDRQRITRKYKPYGDSIVDKIDLKKIMGELVGLGNTSVTGHRHSR